MHSVDIRELDLNLLPVLDVLLSERHVSRAALRLGRSQSAVSHALSRLRDQLDDPLLVRVGGEMRPTPRAQRLAPQLRQVLLHVQRVVSDRPVFDMASDTRVFTLAGPDFLSAILPSLLSRMAVEVPRANIALTAMTSTTLQDTASGRFDIAVAPVGAHFPEGLTTRTCVTMPWAVFMRAGHPAAANWGLDAWLDGTHLRVSTGTSRGPVDQATERAGVRRTLGPSVPHFTMAADVLAATDLFLTVPEAALAGAASARGLLAKPVPLALSPLTLAVVWSATRDADPANMWLRGLVMEQLAVLTKR